MSIDFRKVAQKSVSLAEIMVGKNKGTTEQLIAKNKPVLINDCEMFTKRKEDGTEERIWAFTTKEDEGYFFYAGTVLANVFDDMLAAAQGDFEALYTFINDTHLAVQFKNGKTKKGNPCTLVEVL